MFKESFKYYKSKCPPPDLHEIIDMDKDDDNVSYLKYNFLQKSNFLIVNSNQFRKPKR